MAPFLAVKNHSACVHPPYHGAQFVKGIRLLLLLQQRAPTKPNCLDFRHSKDCSVLSPRPTYPPPPLVSVSLSRPAAALMFLTHIINPRQFPPILPKTCQALLCHHLNPLQRHGDRLQNGHLEVFCFFFSRVAPGASLQIAWLYVFEMCREAALKWMLNGS